MGAQTGWISDIATAITENAKIIHCLDERPHYYINEIIFQSTSRADLGGDGPFSLGVAISLHDHDAMGWLDRPDQDARAPPDGSPETFSMNELP
jgi:hypothetical protein